MNIKEYIKHRSILVLIDSDITHKCIPHKLGEDIHFFVRHVSNFSEICDKGDREK
jgi:hypothetical protein